MKKKIKERLRIKGENKKSEEYKNTFLSSNFVNLLHSTKSTCVRGLVLVHCSHSLFILTQARQKRRNAGKKRTQEAKEETTITETLTKPKKENYIKQGDSTGEFARIHPRPWIPNF